LKIWEFIVFLQYHYQNQTAKKKSLRLLVWVAFSATVKFVKKSSRGQIVDDITNFKNSHLTKPMDEK